MTSINFHGENAIHRFSVHQLIPASFELRSFQYPCVFILGRGFTQQITEGSCLYIGESGVGFGRRWLDLCRRYEFIRDFLPEQVLLLTGPCACSRDWRRELRNELHLALSPLSNSLLLKC